MKKRIRRYTAFALACLLVSAMLAGCGEKNVSETSQETAAQAETESLTETVQTAAEETTSAETGSAEEDKPASEAEMTEEETATESEAGGPEAGGPEAGSVPESQTETKEGESGDIAYYGPQPGELDPAIEGAYGSGRTVVFAGAAYLRQPDGIYLLSGHREPERLVSVRDSGSAEICTDGYMLYYCDGGKVMALDLTAKELKPEAVSGPDYEVPEGSSVVGAGHFTVYVETPGGITDDMYEGASDLTNVVAVSLKTGLPEETFEGYYGGCRGGYTFIRHDSFDVSPQPLKIFGFQGETIVDEPESWGVQDDQGLLWYSVTEEDSTAANAVLYKLDADGPEEILRDEEETGTYYGIWVSGFLACVCYDPGEDAGEAQGTRLNYIDLRTMKPVEAFTDEDDTQYWRGGFTRRGADYLMASEQLFLAGEDGLREIFDIPVDVYSGAVYLTEDRILVEDIEDKILIFDLEPDAEVHPIPVTSVVRTRREAGTEGLQVREYYTQLMSEGAWGWSGLFKAVNAWNKEVDSRSEKLADECYEMAEDLAGYGLYEDYEDPDLKAEIRAYIQRADSSVFSFMEHECVDLVVAPRNYEVKTGYNFSTQDGHALTLDEIVIDLEALAELMTVDFDENFPNGREVFSFYEFVDEMMTRRSLVSTPEFSWVLGYEGISFYYNGSINFPFVRGAWKYYVSFSEHPELFDEKWTKVPDSYSYDVLLDDYFSEDYQIESGKGIKTVLLAADRATDENGKQLDYMDTLSIWVSDAPMGEMRTNQDMAVPIFSDTVSGMILHTREAGGSNYLLIQCNGDSMGMEIFSLDGIPETTFELGQGALPQYCPENGVDAVGKYVTHSWLSDPEFFTILLLDDDPMNGFTKRTFCRLRDGEIMKY